MRFCNSLRHVVALSVLLLTLIGHVLIVAATPPTVPGAETLDTLRRTTVPARDPVDLARRLLGVPIVPTPPPQAREYQIGDVVKFRADNSDKSAQFTVAAQLWYQTPHASMWFQTGFKPDMAAVKRSADIFETHIYPTVHEYFGNEASPGIDGDIHLYIVHVRGLGGSIAGYFSSDSEYPQAVVPSSNEHQMFFINLDALADWIGSGFYESVLAHEFQHMVHANVDPNEDAWLNEGMSVLSELLNGYPDLSYTASFLTAPDTQLNAWSPDPPENSAHYGAAYLFVTYFLQRFGEDALKALAADRAHGLESVASTLRRINALDPETGQPVTVEVLFADWTMATLLNDPRVGDGRYAYSRLPVKPPAPSTEPAVLSAAWQDLPVTQWGTTYLDLLTPGHYQFVLQCAPTVSIVPTAPHSGRKMWWSNRDDHGDTRLTHTFDLTGVSKARLSFWLWYAIEKNWDYGYVELSTDGGATWATLATQDSTPSTGHNNPYGPAYTGTVGGAARAASADWAQQTVDLTPYAGKKIMIRFEYLTDDESTEEGMLIDDISIPEIGYSSDAETGDDGWQAEGWARIDNVLPQRYLVQMAEFGPTPRRFRLLGPGDGNLGNWTLDIGGNVSRLVISVSGLTEFTTTQARCQYQLTPAARR